MRLLGTLLSVVVLAGFFFGSGCDSDPKPSLVVTITSPTPGQQIAMTILLATGSGSFIVSGTSKEVPSGMRVYVLVHPTVPFSPEWGVYPANPRPDGGWSTESWYGGATFPPQQGNEFQIQAVVASPGFDRGQVVDGPEALAPEARSNLVNISIGSTTE